MKSSTRLNLPAMFIGPALWVVVGTCDGPQLSGLLALAGNAAVAAVVLLLSLMGLALGTANLDRSTTGFRVGALVGLATVGLSALVLLNTLFASAPVLKAARVVDVTMLHGSKRTQENVGQFLTLEVDGISRHFATGMVPAYRSGAEVNATLRPGPVYTLVTEVQGSR